MPKPVLGPQRRTNPIIWCTAIICAILAVGVIIGGIVVFVSYLVLRPKVPQVSVTSAQLDTLYFDEISLLTVQVSIVMKFKNDNAKARASFYDMKFALSMGGQQIAYLVAESFTLNANGSVEFNYVPQSMPIPLNPEQAEDVNFSLKQKIITFELKGRTRSRWSVGLISSVKVWLHLDCQMGLPTDGTKIFPKCSSRAK